MEKEKIIIKEAELKDLKEIQELNQQLFDYEHENFDKTIDCSWPSNNEKYFDESIKVQDSLALVAFAGKKIVGYLIGSIKNAGDYRKLKKIAEIDNTFVLPEYRNKGIGTSLCKTFAEWSKNKGIKRMKVIASANNLKTISFYKKNKFNEYDLTLEADI